MRRVFAVLAVSASLAGAAAVPAGAAERPRPASAGGVAPLASGPAADERAAAAKARAAGVARVALTVRLSRPEAADDVVAAAKGHGALLRQRIPRLGAVSIDVPAHAASRVAEALSRRGDVRDVSPVRARHLALTPNDTSWASQATYLGEVNAPAAWDVTHGSADVLIAVVDSGLDTGHADLSGKVAGTYNAVTGTADTTDTVGHGTFVAGVAAAATNNAVGVAGAGYDSRLLGVKVADSNGLIATDDEAAGIVWAADNGAHVINISLGGSTPDALETDAVAYAVSKGAVVVASAGNENTNAASYPAALADVIAVGATNGGSRASFSNYGSWVDVGAPGVNLRSTAPAGTQTFTAPYDTASGTSFSAPLVAGQAALLRAASPSSSAATVASAITSTANATSYGFAAGRVDFAASLASLAPQTVPTITAPSGGDVSGAMTVTATSSAAQVRFALQGGPSATVPVVDGTATTALETLGLASGARQLTAQDCSGSGCGTAATVIVSVVNAPPTITSPAADAEVRSASLTLSATSQYGGGVRFLVDGVPVGTDTSAPFSVTVSASALADGSHTAGAVQCNAAGTLCDAAVPSSVTFTIASLHPAIPSIAPGRFSPNGDGRYDAAVVTYTLDVAQSASLRIKSSSGTVVRGPGAVSGTAGTRTWTWNGRRNDGSYAPDGTYTVELSTSHPSGQTGYASGTVVVDRSAPNMSGTTGAGATVYPVRDGYRDTFVPSIFVSEQSYLSLRIYNPSGTRIRVVNGALSGAGRRSLTWDGKTSSGAIAPAGTYTFDFVATDPVSNGRATGRYTVYVSGKRLVAKVAERVVTPEATHAGAYVGYCSRGTVPAMYGRWTGSYGYYSDYYCDSFGGIEGLVVSDHQLVLPAAVKYGNVQVGAVGREAIAGSVDTGVLSYYDRYGEVTGYTKTLSPTYGTYWGPLAGSSTILAGRTIRWWAGSVNGYWYEIAQFKVRWQYYVLA